MTKHPSTTRRHLTLLFTLILSLGATWAQPTGAINGIFSVAEGQYVYFAKGNLQYNAMQGTHATADGGTAQGTWRFADNQWDYVGSANCNISQTYDGWIDLFGYGTSGWNSGATCYQPWSVSTSNYDYYLGGTHWTNCSNNMEGDYANADWGVYNAISNGGNQPGLWRTLSKDEWDYVFRLRNTLSGIRWARAVVNGVNGLILLPDAWKTSYYSLNGTNDYTASYDVNVIDASTWMNYLESHGAVFFSACGYRGGPTTTANYYYSGGSLGWYHSTTYYSEASSVLEINGYTNAGNLGVSFSGGRYQGLAVRLIQQVPNMSYSINPSCNPTDGGTVLGAGVYIMGSICTLRAIANGGYTFVNWTENGSVVSTDDIYSFCVVGTRNLVANFYYTGGGGVQNGHGYVDLGLPSGLMWATCNIGAVAPEDYGDYFAWAETQPKEIYEWSNYQYCEGTDPFSNRPYLTKYCCNPEYGYNGFTDNLTTLLPEDDAASVYWGADWRIPSKEEFEELINNTTSIWTTQYGVNGRLFTAANGNSIFLPANGIGGTSHSLNAGIYGNYWSNSILEGEYSTYGRMLWFRSNACETDNSLRYFGLSIRPVRSEIQYEVTATSNPILGGTITGAGAYHQGQLCTLTATANTGYVFVNWTEDGNVVSTNPEYNFTVSSARNLVANFAEEGQTCNIVFDLYDSFGDGWNGNYLVVSYGDVTEQFTVGSGSSASYSREVATGSVVSLSWITGSYIRECSFDIKFENGVLIYHGANLSASFQEELTIDCELATAPYLISATSDPSEGGIVEGGGVYEGGSTCTLTATPNSGYSFICWLENGQQVSTNATYSFTVTGNQDLVAHFSVPLTITALSNSSEGGSVTGGGVFDYGTTCTLTATANPGYSFIKWTKNGETVSYFSPFSFSVTEGGDYSAVFEETDGIVVGAPEAANQYLPSYSFYEYSLSQQIYMPDEIGGGTFITGISFFNTGDTKTRNYDIYLVHTDKSAFSSNTDWIAVAESDRVFSGDVTMMSGCWTMIVFDTPFAYNGTSNLAVVIDDNSGNYTYSPHMSCRVFHTENTQAIRIYNIETNYDPFNPSGYNGTLYSEKNQIVFQTSPAFAITASASPSEGGTITGAGSYFNGRTCTLTATANPGYTFIKWTKNGSTVSYLSPFNFVVKESGDYVAVFEETPGIIIGAPEDKNYDLPSYSTDYSSSQQIYTSEEIGWSGTITGLSFFNTYEQTIRDYDIYMVHTDKTSFSSNTDWIAVTESDIVFSGEVTMTAGCWKTIVLDTPFAYNGTSNLAIVINDKTGNSFVYGSTSSMSGRVFNTQAHQAIRYRGLSSFNPYNPFGYSGSRLSVKNQIVLQMTPAFVISASANPTEAGIISGTGSYVEGNTCTLIATPNTGYTFKNWMKNGEVVSTNASYSFTVTGDVTFVANFNTPSYVISATVSPSVGGTVSGEGTFVVGSTCTLTAIPNPGYSFMYWYDTYNMRIVSYDAEYSFTVNGNRELRAYFSLPSTITASPDSSGGGSVTGGGVFDYGVTCTLTATANPGYTFIKWTKNGSTVSYLSPFNFSVTESGDYVAVFEETPGIVVGAPESTNDHLPTYPVGYNLTQQIYTHDEIRGSGAITDISFFNTGTQRAGNYNIYLVHTDKTAFNGNADWIAVTESDRVFSGEVAMMTGCWTTITLDTPFAYNGSSNLAIVVYSYLQGSIYQCSFSCRTFNTPGNQAIYYSGNSVDVLNPYNPSGYNGTLLSVKNQIVFQGIDCQTQTQTVSLSAGWNWVSFYIEADPIELLQMLEEGLGENGIVIKGGDITTEYDEEWGWFGDLDDEGIVNEQMYLVRTVAACTVVMEGTPANPANHAITINPGWNWIGFPCPVSVGIEDAFSGFNAAPCDILKWGDFSTEYDEEWGWFGDIETLVPGQGFLYYSNASTSKTLVFQTGSGK